MIDELREFLVDRDVDCMQITRLEFRNDLKTQDAVISAGCKIFSVSQAREWNENDAENGFENVEIPSFREAYTF